MVKFIDIGEKMDPFKFDIKPSFKLNLDLEFRPMILNNLKFEEAVKTV